MDLRILVFSPLIFSMLLLLPIFSGKSVLIRRFAKIFASLHFLYSISFLLFFDNTSTDNYITEITFFGQKWLGTLGVSLSMSVDSISLLMVILTSLLFLLACVASKGVIKTKHSLYYALIFILETSVLGVFCSRDMFEFFLFWELELVPMYFLISLWGSGLAKKSAMKFLLYTFIGSLFMLCGFLMLYNFNFIAVSELTADIYNITFNYEAAPIYLQVIASILVILGFAVKLPIVPFHSWLPSAHVDAPTPVSMLLAGILLKMGAYGIIRFNIQMLPDAFLMLCPYLAVFAFVNIVYAAVLAYGQTDIKKIVAYSSISVMGLVLLGFCSANSLGICGSIFLMIAHGIISAGLFFIVGVVYSKTGTRQIIQLGGLASVMPNLSTFAVILALGSIGTPLLISFAGEFLVFFGAFVSSFLNSYLIQIISLSSILVLVLSAIYTLKLVHSVFYGNLPEQCRMLNDIAVHEFLILFTLSVLTIILGIIPMCIIDILVPSVQMITGTFGG